MQLTRVTTPLQRLIARSSARIGLYLIVIIASYLVITVVVRTPIQLVGDAAGYDLFARDIRTLGLFGQIDLSIRTYGYPLFLVIIQAVISALSPGVSYLEAVAFVQFVLHTIAALISVNLFAHLLGRGKANFAACFSCFVLIQCNPLLLGLTRDLLTDCLSVFLTMLFLRLLVSRVRFKALGLGTLLGLLIVVRPFYEVWGILFIGCLLLWLGARVLIQHRAAWRAPLQKIGRKQVIGMCGWVFGFLTPCLMIVGLQLIMVYQYEHKIGLIGWQGSNYAAYNLCRGSFSYKYETYLGNTHPPEVFYTFAYFSKPTETRCEDRSTNLWVRQEITHPIDSAFLFTVKAVGMFQNYEWSTYRQTLDNRFDLLVMWGLIPFFCLVYANWAALSRWREHLREPASYPWLVVLLAID